VAIEVRLADRPVVALMPPATLPKPKPMAGAVVMGSVEIEPGGKFHGSGRAQRPQLAAAVATVLLALHHGFAEDR
jgi:hypothetical protein